MATEICREQSASDGAWGRIWRKHFRRACALARKLLRGRSRIADEEDIAAAVFASLYRQPQPTPPVGQTSQFWPLVAAVTRAKVVNALRYEGRQKRGGGRLLGESACADHRHGGAAGFHGLADPTAATALESVMRQEQFQALDPELRHIAEMRIQGFSNLEIAESIGRSLPTVERRLRLLRTLLGEDHRP